MSTISNSITTEKTFNTAAERLNYILIWIDPKIDESKKDFQKSFRQLRNIVKTLPSFTNIDEGVEFINNIQDKKVVLIVSGVAGRIVINRVHEMPQLDSIYIYCKNKSQHETWAKQWTKLRRVCTSVKSLGRGLQTFFDEYDDDSKQINTVSIAFIELLGEQLLQHNESDNDTSLIATSVLEGKTIALYFSGQWCGPCREFTPKLAEYFKKLGNEIKNKLDIVFISCDEDQDSFDEYFKRMPWKALPYSDRDRYDTLREKYDIQGIPALIVISPKCEVITLDGVEELRIAGDRTLQKWVQERKLFWSREPNEDEYVWKDVACIDCFMNPLLGSRYGCVNLECEVNLCETCQMHKKHEHPIIKYLIPEKTYPLKDLLKSLPYLLSSTNKEQIETKTMWVNDVKSVGFYFAANWCPPCRSFTPKLINDYNELQASTTGFRIIFVSYDQNKAAFETHHAEMPWLAVPFNEDALLKAYFQPLNIPSLYVMSSDGKVLSDHGCSDVTLRGNDILKSWAKGEKLLSSPSEEYEWLGVRCNGCNMYPLIGQRYYCEICGNYNLCTACRKEEHEHPLKLLSRPDEDDERCKTSE